MDEGTKTITATELKANLGKYLDCVMHGGEVVITRNGERAARLTPYITEIERYFAVKEKAREYLHGGKKVSYEEFMGIYEKSELRMEYINGEIVLPDPPDTCHQDISGNLYIHPVSYTHLDVYKRQARPYPQPGPEADRPGRCSAERPALFRQEPLPASGRCDRDDPAGSAAGQPFARTNSPGYCI